jgi:hypothetical protein
MIKIISKKMWKREDEAYEVEREICECLEQAPEIDAANI